MGWGEKPWRQRERERERETMRSREWKQAGEAEPGVAKNRVTLPCKRLNPVKQCPLEPHSRPHSDRSLLPPLQPQPTTTPYTAPLPTATPSRSPPFFIPHHPFANFCPHTAAAPPPPATLYHPSLHTSANFPSLAPPRGLFPSRSAPLRLPSGRAGVASHRAGHRLPSPQIRTTDPSPPEHAQKKSGIRCRMPPHGTDAPPTRGRRPYRPLRAGRRTRPAYWPQSTPR